MLAVNQLIIHADASAALIHRLLDYRCTALHHTLVPEQLEKVQALELSVHAPTVGTSALRNATVDIGRTILLAVTPLSKDHAGEARKQQHMRMSDITSNVQTPLLSAKAVLSATGLLQDVHIWHRSEQSSLR